MRVQGHYLVRIGAMLTLLGGVGAEDALASVLRVPQDFSTIQAAVDAADSGDVIRVGPGTYSERITISKSSIRLEADPVQQAVLDGANLPGVAISILGTSVSPVKQVSVVGFTIENYEGAGIALMFTERCQILSNSVNNTTAPSIALARTAFTLVAGNTLSNGTFGVGISMRSTDNTVKENTISGAFIHGIRVSMIKTVNQPLLRNLIKENVICVDDPTWSETGILIADFASGNTVKENKIVGNGIGTAGIRLEAPTSSNLVKENILNGHAIDIDDLSSANTVTENVHHRSLKCR